MQLVLFNYRDPCHLEFYMPFESFSNLRNAKKYEKKDSAGSEKRKAVEEEDDEDDDEEEDEGKPKPKARKTESKVKAKSKSKAKK